MVMHEQSLVDADEFQKALDDRIASRRKMTSPLYQVILEGKASRRLLQSFVIHRYPIKAFWTRNILGIASRIEDYTLRRELVENIHEEETGAASGSRRHLESFVDFGTALGLQREEILDRPVARETADVIAHNVGVCNDNAKHFTQGVASVLLLMEGQPPIVDARGSSMLRVMRDIYGLPPEGYDYFVHHASVSVGGGNAVSELEEDHAATAKNLLRKYCSTPEHRQDALLALDRAIDLRHRHFDMIHREAYTPEDAPFRHGG